MVGNKSDEPTESKQDSISGPVISSLIIGLAGIFIKDHPGILQGVVLCAPSAGYGIVEFFKYTKRRLRLNEICDVIDEAIKVEEASLADPKTGKAKREEINAEIRRLKQLKLSHRLGDLEIKSLKE